MDDKCHIAYVMYWGATEPVGFATAVPTVLGLAERANVTLVSFEKEEDWTDLPRVQRQRARLDAMGVRWLPIRYTPGYRGAPLDVLRGAWKLFALHRKVPIDVVEGRTFVGGLIGAVFARLSGRPFVYHTEGCWVEEQNDVGRLDDASAILRVLRVLDRWIADRAGALIALTEGGACMLRRTLLRSRPGVPLLVVPTTSVLVSSAADVGVSKVIQPGEPVRAIYSGSVTGRYLLDELLLFVKALFERRPGSKFTLLAHRDRDVVRSALRAHGLMEVSTVGAVPHDELAAHIREADVGFFFLKRGPSEPCVSPTKIPEYLAHGLTVVSTRASGDGAGVIERARAGVVLEDPTDPASVPLALDELDRLLTDPDRGRRAQAAAREFYSLDRAISLQYEALTGLARRSR